MQKSSKNNSLLLLVLSRILLLEIHDPGPHACHIKQLIYLNIGQLPIVIILKVTILPCEKLSNFSSFII